MIEYFGEYGMVSSGISFTIGLAVMYAILKNKKMIK